MTLTKTGDESGVERWEEPDRSAVEFRARDGQVLRFATFRETTWYGKKKIGTKITTRNSRFEFARIDSVYYIHATAQVYGVKYDDDSDSNDTYLDEYESQFLMGDFPARVDSLCRAQWHGARFRYTVTRGPRDVFTPVPVNPFPSGWPEEWPPPRR